MPTTFLKRQKEMKRQEKAREKAERRRQKKLAGKTETGDSMENVNPEENALLDRNAVEPSEPNPA